MITIKTGQEIQLNWSKIERSTYCKNYKKWKNTAARECYWDKRKLKGSVKEQWARIRCGCVGKAGENGYRHTKYKLCKEGKEDLVDILRC